MTKLAWRAPRIFRNASATHMRDSSLSFVDRLGLSFISASHYMAYQLGALQAFKAEGRPSTPMVVTSANKFRSAQRIVLESIPRYGLILGAMKCGTSALFNALTKHPQICAAKNKEPRFFCTPADFSKGIGWYTDLFDFDSNRHLIALEASTRNTGAPKYVGAPDRMLSTGWNFRFVYIVRDPIERIESHYLHGVINNFGLNPLKSGLDRQALDLSRYHYQISKYVDAFGKDSVLVISHEQWKEQAKAVIEKVCEHFEIDPSFKVQPMTVHSSEFHYRSKLIARELRERGHQAFGATPHLIQNYLQSLCEQERQTIERAVASHYTLSSEHIRFVRRELADEMKLLHSIYGIDVEKWQFMV